MRCLLPFVLLLAACDTAIPEAPDAPFVYRTDQAEFANGVADLGGGRLLVWGDVEGRPRPADGTNAYPAALRIDGDALSGSLIYREGGFGGAAGAVARPDGAVALLANLHGEFDHTNARGFEGLRLVLFDADGTPRVRYSHASVYAASSNALRLAPDGGFFLLESGAQGGLVRLDADGRERWRVRPDALGSPFVDSPLLPVAFDVAPDGTAYLLSLTLDHAVAEITRVQPDGRVGGKTDYGFADDAHPTYPAVIRAGTDGPVALLRGARNRIVRLTPAGIDTTIQVAAGFPGLLLPGDDGNVYAARVTGGGGNFGPTTVSVERYLSGAPASPQVLGTFGQQGRFNSVGGLAVLADGRLAVAGGVGPRSLNGYGGDDFDLRVAFYRR